MASRKEKLPELWACRPGSQKGGFIQIWKSFLDEEAFKKLTKNQRLLYIYMVAQFNGNKTKNNPNGEKDQFYFNWQLVKKYCLYSNHDQFKRDRDALINAGFIECVENNRFLRKKNVYRFSHRWLR